MNITVERSAFLISLRRVARIAEDEPILIGVVLTAANGTLTLTTAAFDFDLADTIPAEIIQPGSCDVLALTLLNAIRDLSEGSNVRLVYNEDNGHLTIGDGQTQSQLETRAGGYVQAIRHDTFTHAFSLPARQMRELFARTAFVTSEKGGSPILNGVYLHIPTRGRNGSDRVPLPFLRAVTADEHCIARTQVARPSGCEGMPGVIIPRDVVTALMTSLDIDADARIEVSDRTLRVMIGSVVLTSTLIDVDFQDYEDVIPSGHDRVLTLDRLAFLSAIARVTSNSKDDKRELVLTLSKNAMTLKTHAPDTGDTVEEIEVSYRSAAMTIGLSGRFLAEVAGHLVGSEMRIMLSDPETAIIITDLADAATVYVLMPMRM